MTTNSRRFGHLAPWLGVPTAPAKIVIVEQPATAEPRARGLRRRPRARAQGGWPRDSGAVRGPTGGNLDIPKLASPRCQRLVTAASRLLPQPAACSASVYARSVAEVHWAEYTSCHRVTARFRSARTVHDALIRIRPHSGRAPLAGTRVACPRRNMPISTPPWLTRLSPQQPQTLRTPLPATSN